MQSSPSRATLRCCPVTGWFGFHGSQGGWTRGGAYADERQTWLKQLSAAASPGLGVRLWPRSGLRQARWRTFSAGDRHLRPPRPHGLAARVHQPPLDLDRRCRRRRAACASPPGLRRATGAGCWSARRQDGRHQRDGRTGAGSGQHPGPGTDGVASHDRAGRTPARPAAHRRYRVRGPTRIEATARGASGWSFIVLRQAYDPAWLASVAGEAFAPLLADGLWNGYLLPVSDGAALTFEYAPQRWYDIGIVISAVTALGLAAGLVLVGAGFPRRGSLTWATLARLLRH